VGVLLPLFLGLQTNLKGGELKIGIWENDIIFPPRKLADPRSRFLNTDAAQEKGSWCLLQFV